NTASSSVVAHEWGHGVDERYGGLSQIDGLSEGWGDICSEYLLDNPIIGPGFFTTGAGIRTGLNTAQFPVSSGDPHAQGETFMGFAWLYRENLRTAFGTTLAIAISNADVLGSIPANAQNQTDAIIAVFVADDDDGNLANGVPHYNQLVPACQAHNLPFPGIQAGTVTHVQIGNTSDQLTPRTVLASAVPTFGSFTALTVFYNDGSSHTRSMIPTGTANQYQALLPGLLPPATMTYHIEALHSTGIIYRLPVLGEYSTRVIGQSRIVLDDFENGGIGWTHGLITGEDDWQIGTPTGQSGAGWTDPPSAYSGTQCAGNDLGIGGSDGAYSNNVENWLRSPVFNCTGRTGVRLRFKRWLTVDRGSLDLASIRFGTAFVWVNPTATAQLDTGWTQFDMPVGLADNNPNVQFEWRLRSNGTVTFGGWAIDDFELVDATPSPLPAQLQILPEQAVQGSPMTLSINTGAPRPFLFILGSTGGPTTIPGVPLILVGGTTVSVPGFTNASGLMTVPFTAPAGVPVTGLPWFSQVLTLDATSNIVASNQFLNLFTN
ncbi:MAG TPA: hypothetical protein VK348_15315, partial [Planctomycetota bacterium]|nr:hypothetical protein [Planctomycetota bacterium]